MFDTVINTRGDDTFGDISPGREPLRKPTSIRFADALCYFAAQRGATEHFASHARLRNHVGFAVVLTTPFMPCIAMFLRFFRVDSAFPQAV